MNNGIEKLHDYWNIQNYVILFMLYTLEIFNEDVYLETFLFY